MAKIVVAGSINMDLVISAPRLPVIGETILGSGFVTNPGGKGANQAVAAARLGCSVAMIGCVGDDFFGKNLIDNLKADGIDTGSIKILQGTPTGVAVILIEKGNNCIIVDPGANAMLEPGDMQNHEELIRNCDLVITQLEIPIETVKHVLKTAKKNNVRTLLNPAPAAELGSELLEMVDVLTPNETECEIMTGVKIKSIEDAKTAARILLGRGAKNVAVTLGANGAVYNCGERLIHKPAREVKVVDTTAAGDSFSGALAAALSDGADMDSAIDFANAVGSLTVTRKGAQTSLPYLSQVREYMGR